MTPTASAHQDEPLLAGLTVLDFTRVLAGPHCTKALRDLGADVIKIEPPSGDIGRVGLPFVSGIGLYFVQQNAGKRNLSLDLNYEEARQIAVDLCRDADVIVENFRPGTLARFKLSYDDVRAYNERVIYVTRSYLMFSLDAKTGLPDPTFGTGGMVDLRKNDDQDMDPVRGVMPVAAIHGPGSPTTPRRISAIAVLRMGGRHPSIAAASPAHAPSGSKMSGIVDRGLGPPR